MKKQYMCPKIDILDLQKILASKEVTGEWPAASGGGGGAESFDAKRGGFWDEEESNGSSVSPVGGTAGTGKSALELPSQNRKIWGD